MPTPHQIKYCPRCDKPFAGLTVAEAMALVRAHMKLAHPDEVEMLASLTDD